MDLNICYRHFMGEIYPVEDFTDYQELLGRFEKELEAFINEC